jgi:hypothetical protein
MFGKKANNAVGGAEAGKKAEMKKEQKLSPHDALLKEIEQITNGQRIDFQLPALYGGDVIIIALNPDYPKKGRKYAVINTDLVDGKPGDKKRTLWETDKPKTIVNWLLEKGAQKIS